MIFYGANLIFYRHEFNINSCYESRVTNENSKVKIQKSKKVNLACIQLEFVNVILINWVGELPG